MSKIGNDEQQKLGVAVNLIACYCYGNEEKALQQARTLLDMFKQNQYQFTTYRPQYLMAKAFYFLLRVFMNKDLSEEDDAAVAKLVYFYILKNYLVNNKCTPSDEMYEDYIGGCQFAVVIIVKCFKFISETIFPQIGLTAHSLCTQLAFFYNILENAGITHIPLFVEEKLTEDYNEIIAAISEDMHETTDFAKLKQDNTIIIAGITTYLAGSFPLANGKSLWKTNCK